MPIARVHRVLDALRHIFTSPIVESFAKYLIGRYSALQWVLQLHSSELIPLCWYGPPPIHPLPEISFAVDSTGARAYHLAIQYTFPTSIPLVMTTSDQTLSFAVNALPRLPFSSAIPSTLKSTPYPIPHSAWLEKRLTQQYTGNGKPAGPRHYVHIYDHFIKREVCRKKGMRSQPPIRCYVTVSKTHH